MKKLFSIALVVMMLISCFAVTASASDLTISVTPVDSSFRDDSADASVLTDGVKEGGYNVGLTVNTQGTNKWTDYTLSFSTTTMIDTIVVYGGSPAGGASWNLGDEADRYVLKVNGETIATKVSVDRSADAYVVVTIKFEATKLTSAVLSISQNKYAAAIYEIETPGSTAVEEPSQEESSEAFVEESTEASVEESTEASVEESAEASVDESAEASVEESTEASVEESAETSAEEKSEASSETSEDKSEDKGGISPVVIIIIIVAVIAVAAVVVVIILKKKK